ncbi:winged helix-turn-helix domain-containing protein [Cellulomonas shaoxiangyii]|uniref:Winged helix-turn-helix domain-containing protein n=1 Tax=Cellulomonas shaoxiangyii TaxID=2566013 RepID=A0A4P7SG70_9CELL|nr:crosslink repair DNA glycosylase YcaQ family protein [Cellulomonas shaoxiangyii]QCB93169.1 winged helix-turn-helix domain-containing protein [Cellulomonas shaoxiangyii]TGY77805.1 winged helix-turn-helix domain-containing protein [Cellulomonas shaoxiangyii]
MNVVPTGAEVRRTPARPSAGLLAAARPAPRETLTVAQVRRAALRASGLDRPRPGRTGPVGTRGLQAVVDRLGLLQIDSVNVLARAHLVPVYARVGPWDPTALDRAAGAAPRRLVETWAHEASFVPPTTFRDLAFKHDRLRDLALRRGVHIHGVPIDRSAEVAEVRALVDAHGPVTAREAHALLGSRHARPTDHWGWNWTVAKRALEYLFDVGELTSAGRNAQFERRYDRADRVLPPAVVALPRADEAESARRLVATAARAHGVATVRTLADHWRIRVDRAQRAVDELVEEGVLVPVQVLGWRGPAYRHRDSTVPRRVAGSALLSPFDPLVWERSRTEALFGLRYRIEIYVPAERRVWGYYVLPFLLGDRLEALVDLKADRAAGVLRVAAAHRAPGGPVGGDLRDDVVVARALAAELRTVARWLGLGDVLADGAAGGLAVALGPALREVADPGA